MTANDGKNLGAIGIEARELFSVLTGASKKLPLTARFFDPQELVDQFEKFELWALNLGLNAPGHSSLDYRLRDWEVARDIVRRLLEDVRDALADIELLISETLREGNGQYEATTLKAEAGISRSLGETSPNNASELADELRALGYESDDEGIDTLTDDLLMNRQKVSDALDRLYRIATKLRNPTTRLISEQISLYKHIDADTGVDLMTSYAEYDQRHIRELLNQRIVNTDDEREVSQVETESRRAEMQHFLVSRLAQGNSIRRKQFYQWRRHRIKLEYAVYSSSEVPEERNNQVVRKTAPLVLGAPSAMGYSLPTTATNLNVQSINWDEDKSIASVSEYAANADASEEDLAYFPDPPSKKEGTRYFECPYCLTICPNAYLRTQDAWRNHLIRDLRPYMCTYKDCISGQELWTTSADWVQHEDSCHRKVWRCLEHSNLTFETRKAYDDHLKHDHKSASEQLRTFELLRAGESSETDARRPCPFCGKDFQTVLETERHIAMHMERIAAFTLPRSAGQEDESAYGSNWSVQARNRVVDQHSELESSTENEPLTTTPTGLEAVGDALWADALEEFGRQNGAVNLVDEFVRRRDGSVDSFVEAVDNQSSVPNSEGNNHQDEQRVPPFAPEFPLPGNRPKASYFGVSLDEMYQRDKSPVPEIVYQCVQAVDLFGLDVEGIYRISGSAAHILEMEAMFENNPSQVDFRNPAFFRHDIASVTTLLKHFLRDLPDPLLTSSSYNDFIAAAKIDDDISRRDSLHALINDLPDPNYATLRVLSLHLWRVAQHSDRNRMTPANLAICFGPIFFGISAGRPDTEDARWQARVVETILNNALQIFDDDSDDGNDNISSNAASAGRPTQLAKLNLSQVSEDNDVGHDDDNIGSNTVPAEGATQLAKWIESQVSEDNDVGHSSGIPPTPLGRPEQPATQKRSSRIRSFFSRGKKNAWIDRRSID